MSNATAADFAVAAVVAARFLLPLAIPKYPLPGVFASLMVDAADQTVFQSVLGADLSRYQPYDKALDIYLLSILMLATLRNWQSRPAVVVARVLFYVRVLGVLAFELTGWRPLLVIFPNTFEYFFIFYEIVRAWWSPARLRLRTLLLAAATLWMIVKVPQEYLLQVARLGLTDLIREQVIRAPVTARWADGLAALLSVVTAAAAVAALALLVRAVAGPRQHPLRLAADLIAGARESAGHVAERWRILDRHLIEKVVLVGSLTLIFAQIVPGMDASPVQLVGGVAIVAAFNSLLLLRWTRRGRPVPPPALAFLLLAITNIGIVLLADLMLRRHHGGMSLPASAFSLLLLSLIVTLYDRWHPVFEERFGEGALGSNDATLARAFQGGVSGRSGHHDRNDRNTMHLRMCLPTLMALGLVPTAAAQLPRFEVIDVPGSSGTVAYAINDAGDVVGHYRDQRLWRGFLLHAGQFTTIDVPGATQTTLFGINAGGDVAGAFYDSAGKQHGFLLSAGTLRTIDVPGAAQTMVYGLNSRGDVTGMYFAAGDTVKHYGFVMAGGRFTTLDHPLPNVMSCGTWIGDSGEVHGHVEETNGTYSGYRWKEGTFTLVALPGGPKGQFWDGLYGINAAGDLLGTYSDAQGKQLGFLRQQGGVTTFDVPGSRRTRTTRMNRRGQVVGMFVDSAGVSHGFLAWLAPTPPSPGPP